MIKESQMFVPAGSSESAVIVEGAGGAGFYPSWEHRNDPNTIPGAGDNGDNTETQGTSGNIWDNLLDWLFSPSKCTPLDQLLGTCAKGQPVGGGTGSPGVGIAAIIGISAVIVLIFLALFLYVLKR